MMLLFYAGQQLVNDLGSGTGWWDYVEINQFTAGVFSIGFVFGAYMTETFRGAILAIPRGQIEAGIACGMTSWMIFRRITWPQMVRFALPSFTNNWLVLVKATALVSVIGLHDLVWNASTAGRSIPRTFHLYVCGASDLLGADRRFRCRAALAGPKVQRRRQTRVGYGREHRAYAKGVSDAHQRKLLAAGFCAGVGPHRQVSLRGSANPRDNGHCLTHRRYPGDTARDCPGVSTSVAQFAYLDVHLRVSWHPPTGANLFNLLRARAVRCSQGEFSLGAYLVQSLLVRADRVHPQHCRLYH